MDSFEFEACDDDGCSTATATITVTAINDAPVAKDATAKTGAGTAVVVELEASDVEGDSLTYDISGAPAHGAVTIDGGRARYEPAAGFSGSDSFRFRAADPSGEVGEATVTVEVAPPPPEPAKTTEPDSTTPSSNPPNHPSDTGKPSPTGPIAGSAAKVTGTVLVTLPGGRAKALEPGGKLPQAAIIDASAGTITIDVARTGSSAGPPQRLTAAQGSFVLKTVREEGKRVLVLRMHASTPAGTRARAASAQPAGTLRLVVSGRCSCRVVSRDAKVTPIRAARWTTVQTAKGTKVNVASGHVTVVDRIHPCPAHVVPQPLATSPSSDRSGYYVAYTPLKHKPVPGRSKQRPRC
jgi:hypothetical protein